MKKKYIQAVTAKDLDGVRLFLTNELMLDPRGGSFSEMRAMAEAHFDNLYEPDNGKNYENKIPDENLLFEIKNDLNSNFSFEKLEKYEEIAKTVLKAKAKQLELEEAENVYEGQSYRQERIGSSHKQIYKGVALGGAALTIAGVCLSKIVITYVGLTALVVGGGLLYKSTKK